MIKDINVPAKACTCNVCGYFWVSVANKIPDTCRNKACRSREWNGKKKRVRTKKAKIELPKPKRIKAQEEDEDGF
jgi:hypothetical protein